MSHSFQWYLVIATLSITEIESTLMDESFNRLNNANEIKKNAIEGFFAQRAADIEVLAKTQAVKLLYNDLEDLYEELEIDTTKPFPIKEDMVKRRTAAYENFFQHYVKTYGYYDVFFIDTATGQVIYTAAKESDYGANLKTGALKDSGLGEVFAKALKTTDVVYADMRPYGPSNNNPAIFLAKKVEMYKEYPVVIALQISDKAITQMMSYRSGYAASQEDYLVGSDLLMRSDSFLDPTNHSLIASFTNPALGKVETEATADVFSGKSATRIIKDYNNQDVLSSYTALKVSNDITWAIISEIDLADVERVPHHIRNSIILWSTIVLLLIVGLVIFTTKKALLTL